MYSDYLSHSDQETIAVMALFFNLLVRLRLIREMKVSWNVVPSRFLISFDKKVDCVSWMSLDKESNSDNQNQPKLISYHH